MLKCSFRVSPFANRFCDVNNIYGFFFGGKLFKFYDKKQDLMFIKAAASLGCG
jgi:hypothetical protein